ncbi:teichoic acids export ABC transporter ATP-binding subunit TagH [Salinicoccus hispanicus]|uniref:Teichoic acids export ABC transporter ATP-binding subunit TagH n=1 Tax=Salinicoccus hispanicus TaxID=157225 RepID=A0A6N8TYV0_9STAP|nr:teichoic acids export ABC transporter ATP-binding subunit TagH [Salinicoccus hispanicus]MXQ50950.1 teichoic acids export ABC transporter ATP-binding subunit TagH [Salinicoccus hispanicus]
MTKAIITKNLTKQYTLYDSQKARIVDLLSPRSHGRTFHALNGVDFEADKGDVVGFIGINGSGKSTLSNIIAGIVPESGGEVHVNGQTALIAVASGLNDELTGRDNIELKCLMLGFSKNEIKALEPDIIAFSELENFIDQPVKSYSSGMKSRLGFAISVNVDPDILIIDEALSVGDKAFAEKSLKKMLEFKEQGKTMVFVSHSISQMKSFCDKILWLEFGRVKAFGEVRDILPLYESFLLKWQAMSKEERDDYRAQVMNRDPNEYNYKQYGNLKILDDGDELSAAHGYTVEPISRLAHLKAHATHIYETPDSTDNLLDAQNYKNRVYYVKRVATYQFENYYLLSTKPSATEGVIGWIKAIETTSHVHIHVDYDHQDFVLRGRGYASSAPWGGHRQYVHASLADHADASFTASETVLIGNNVWYRGCIKGEDAEVWIHSNNVISGTHDEQNARIVSHHQ